MGRPTALTPQLQEALCEQIRRIPIQEEAAAKVGISTATLYNWKQRGRNGEQPYADFLEAVRLAVREGKHGLRDIMRQAALADPKHWKAAESLLERVERTTQRAADSRRLTMPPGMTEADFFERLERDANEKLALVAEWRRSRALPAVIEAELCDGPDRKVG